MSRKWLTAALAGLAVLVLVVTYLTRWNEPEMRGIERALAAEPNPYRMSLRVTVRDVDGEARITRTPEDCETSPDRMLSLCSVPQGQEALTVAGFGATGAIRNHHDPCCWDQGDLTFNWRGGGIGFGYQSRLMNGKEGPFDTDWYVRPLTLSGEVGDEVMVGLPQDSGVPPWEIWVQLPEGVSIVDISDRYASEYDWCYEMREKPGWAACPVAEMVYPLYLSVRLDRKVEGAKGRIMVGHHPGDPDASNDRAEITVDIR
ncbi:hypothetical protein [Streptomyces sp. NPDC101132]|uniref:hypothetical protein n=1 Tax=Streptomyces sp. NPDC101132 TaxID=3366110 RepID=UPI0038048814